MARPRRREKGTPTPLADLVATTEAGRAGAVTPVTRALWERVAGVVFARRTAPDRLQRGTLFLTVASNAWAQEVALHEKVLVERLQARGVAVERLRFRVGEVPEPDRGGVVGPALDDLRKAAKVEPDAATMAELAKVEDPELRKTLERVARAAVRRDAKQEAEERIARAKGKPRVPGAT